ncbi:hypothetical protein EDB83DRAFT_2518039 [Lactarius deliciosus]|nr:hypothetical protein EDB83DRAFT_2518039 [Lactarius deliciosus]
MTPDPISSAGSTAPRPTGISTQITGSQGSRSQPLSVEVTVLRAHNVPDLKTTFRGKREYFVTITYGATTKKTKKQAKKRTKSVHIDGQTLTWDERLDAFLAQPSSRITLRLYAKKKLTKSDILIGTHDMTLPVESQINIPVTLGDGNGNGQAGPSTQPVTLNLTITVSANGTSRVVRRIKWVMDTLGPAAELHPIAQMVYKVLSVIPEELSKQYQRDDNVRTLLKAMHDAFDFANHEDTVKTIKPKSKEAEILTQMLQDVSICNDFIRSYIKDPQFSSRMAKSMVGGVEEKIQELSFAFEQNKKAFLDQAIVTTKITAFEILNDVGIISTKADGILTQLKRVSSQASDAALVADIREIPYREGSRFKLHGQFTADPMAGFARPTLS